MSGDGGVVVAVAAVDGQLPRFTSLLRSLPGPNQSQHAATLDVQSAFIARKTTLQHLAQAHKDALKGASLKALLFPEGGAAPSKSARQDYELFLKTMSQLRGEVDVAEADEMAGALWQTLSIADIPGIRNRQGVAAAHAAARDAITQAIGPFDLALQVKIMTQYQGLKGWYDKQAKTRTTPTTTSASPTPTRVFGADLDVLMPSNTDTQSTITAMCSPTPGSTLLPPPPLLPAPSPHHHQGTSHDEGPAVVGKPIPQARKGGPSAWVAAGVPVGPATLTMGDFVMEDGELDDEEVKHMHSKHGAVWLHDWCTNAAGTVLDDNMMGAVCRVLMTEPSNDIAAAQLFELLGDHAVEAIGKLLPMRASLVNNLQSIIRMVQRADAREGGENTHSTVRFTTALEQKLEKQQRRERRRGKEKTQRELDADWIIVHGFCTLVEAERDLEAQTNTGRVIVDGLEFKIDLEAAQMMGANRLPVGTQRKMGKSWEEVCVPAAKPAPPLPENELIAIDNLPAWAQLAFKGYTHLNRIQSTIFDSAFYTNQNLLVCAPTGAGKTNIAMIAVLHEVSANMDEEGNIQRDAFKVVYVAPMKALAAEVTAAFAKRLQPLGLTVRELTGDMQLTKRELAETHMIVTTPEKWDVITRKGGDVAVASLVKLLIIDEVHLLNDDRGAVIETLVARTKRQVESSQSMIRIVGLSATLPNYKDVASFLGVNHETGLFFFDQSYRPVPLEMTFVGVSAVSHMQRTAIMDNICYEKVVGSLKQGQQAMVFVHARKETGRAARMLQLKMQQLQEQALFDCSEHPKWGLFQRDVAKSRNKEMSDLFGAGIGIHHAGMLRADRTLMERLFAEGLLKVLCCTATLAWGVNLPAHTVIIKGTQMYDAAKGQFTDIGLLDVQQIFGRAGRPQYQDTGEGIIITSHDKLSHYLGMLTSNVPIESTFEKSLVDNLNAEIVLGTVSNVREATQWLSYTYMYRRMLINPLSYGIKWVDLQMDPSLETHRRTLVSEAARQLEKCRMARFDEASGNMYVTELGRVASHFYIRHSTIVEFNLQLRSNMTFDQVLSMMACAGEFENVAVREDELPELDALIISKDNAVPYGVQCGVENKAGKVNVLMQAYISRAHLDSFSLTADMLYISSNAPRIARALFEIVLRKGWAGMTETMLTICKCFELRQWPHQHALTQFMGSTPGLTWQIIEKLDERDMTLDRVAEMDASEVGSLLRHPAAGSIVMGCVHAFPTLELDASMSPITRQVLRVVLQLKPAFNWRDRVHGSSLRWLILVQDSDTDKIYHSELWTLTKRMAAEAKPHTVAFTIPIHHPLPTQHYIRVMSEHWLHAEAFLPLSFHQLILPELHPPHTTLLDLDPLPVSALNNPVYESMYTRFSHFNPIQTQAFHVLYHTDESVLLGAPTGSGKTITAEITMLRLFNAHPGRKVVYIAPLKALVRERIDDWNKGLCKTLGKTMVELTGDYTPDIQALLAADIIICTPEKWDGISRSWQVRKYVRGVGLIIIDEIHMLGADRGPTLETIVSRMRHVAARTLQSVRFVGLSTALANAHDLAAWLGVGSQGLFNFKPSVRPVPLECHISGYPGRFYCPRMASMNKPAYAAIQTHSPHKPVLVFVSSRRQTRLTAMDLIAHAAADELPQRFVKCAQDELDAIITTVKDATLRHTLQFGIGLHHAGLADHDRKVSETLFVEGKIQVLVATSTLAWGVNTPAHLVIIKGTEFYDAASKRYVDFPITDVLQMMGRAGRPQYDKHGVAVIMVHEPKKQFYKKFLYEPFPVESSLPGQLADHLNAEVVAGTIRSTQEAIDWLTWTYFFIRLAQNPSYYHLEDTSQDSISTFLSSLVQHNLHILADAGCLEFDQHTSMVNATTNGRIASFYYLHHTTMAKFSTTLSPDMPPEAILRCMCNASEYDELPVRHNEEILNAELAKHVPVPVDVGRCDDPHVKAELLLQAHLSRVALPIADYGTDTKAVLDNALRLLQAMIDMAAGCGWLGTTLAIMKLVQMIMQARWHGDDTLTMLPSVTAAHAIALRQMGYVGIAGLLKAAVGEEHGEKQGGKQQGGKQQGGKQQGGKQEDGAENIKDVMQEVLGSQGGLAAYQALTRLPLVHLHATTAHAPAAPVTPPITNTVDAHEKGDPVAVGEKHKGSGQGDPGGLVIEVQLQRRSLQEQVGGGGRTRKSFTSVRAYAPRYPKIKDEGWWLILANPATSQLLTMRRCMITTTTTTRLVVPLQHTAMLTTQPLVLLCMSDSYLGLDVAARIVPVEGSTWQDGGSPVQLDCVDVPAAGACTGGGGGGVQDDVAGVSDVLGMGGMEVQEGDAAHVGGGGFLSTSTGEGLHVGGVEAVPQLAQVMMEGSSVAGAAGTFEDEDANAFW